MPVRVLLASLAVLLLLPCAAFASLADEERQGQALAAQLQSGAKSCYALSAEDLDHIGEYVMGHFLGSTAAHEAMNERMRVMMGDQAEGRMHQLMGARFAGCATQAGATSSYRYGPMMGGGGVMGGSYGSGGWSAMMSSREFSWMTGGSWRNMSRADWLRLRNQLLGVSASAGRDGWSAGAVAAVALGGALLAGLLAFLVVRRRPFRRPPAASSRS